MKPRTMLFMLLWAIAISRHDARWSIIGETAWLLVVLLIGIAFHWSLKEDKWN